MISLRYAKYDLHKRAHGELIDQLKLTDRLLQEFAAAVPTTTAHLPQNSATTSADSCGTGC